MLPGEQSSRVAEAKRLYRRVLASWANDALELRRLGLDRPGYRTMSRSIGREREGDRVGQRGCRALSSRPSRAWN